MTLAEFAPIFAMLAVQLRQTDADEATIRGYYESMKALEPEYVAMAAKELAQSSEWFPKTSEWHAAALKVQRTRIADLQARLRNRPEPLCLACDDTGWARVGEAVKRCECASLRRLEVLGRRPMPALPEAKV